MNDDVINDISNTIDELGDVELAGIRLEKADPRLLNVDELNLHQHVAMQPSAVAYYGSLLKDASRRLEKYKKEYNRWWHKKYAEAKANVEKGTNASRTITKTDVEARIIIDNESEINKWEDKIEDLQGQYDTLVMWYEAWKQKSFTLTQCVSQNEDELNNSYPSRYGKNNDKSENSNEEDAPADRVKDIIGRRQSS